MTGDQPTAQTSHPQRVLCLSFLLVCALLWLNPAPAQEAPARQLPAPLLSWQAGKLTTQWSEPSPSFRATLELINAGRFDDALASIPKVEGPQSQRLRAELALAIAGHLDVFDPEPPLTLAEESLKKALAETPDDPALLRLQNQFDLYRAVPDNGLPTDPFLLPARDLIAEGKVDEGRAKITESNREDRIRQGRWVLAAIFEGRDDLAILLDDAETALREAGGGKLLDLLLQHRQHPWASLSVQPDSLLYPRVLLARMRSYYWWWRQMGERYRPMSKQGFFELLGELEQLFPDNDLVRMYKGEKIPWGEGFRPDPVPEGAPGWAVNQRELRARVDHIVEWWFDHRQAPDGALGGGWEDDCETLRRWAVTAICCGNPKIEAGIARLVDGIWSSGELVDGYDRVFKDVEHSSEMAADTSVMVALAYGDPLYVERAMATARTTKLVHTAYNDRGHRHYKAMKMSATEVSEEPRHGVDAQYCGRAMRPAAMVAWYSNIPQATSLVHEWARAWSEDTFRAGPTKPAGIMPATIRFSDDNVDGSGSSWWDPGLGDLYDWRPGRQDMALGKMLGAWMLTHDPAVLAGPKAQFDLLQRYAANPVENPATGSLDWAGMQLVPFTARLIGMYRAYTGDTAYDDVLRSRAGGYARFLATLNPNDVEAAHASSLNNMRFNLPMVTSEVRGTDRVDLRPETLLGPLTGSPVSITEPPSFAVTWREVDVDFTALVRGFNRTGLSAWLYSFADAPALPEAHFWRLEPGKYELRCGPDADADGQFDTEPAVVVPFECRERLAHARLELPPRTLWLLDVVQLDPLPALPVWAADLAVMLRDISLAPIPTVGTPCKVTVIVHNIGSADVPGVNVRLSLRREGDAAPTVIGDASAGRLPFPHDLQPKTASATFDWTPPAPGAYTLIADVAPKDSQPEVYTGNNRAELAVAVQ